MQHRHDAILEVVAFAAEGFMLGASWGSHLPTVLERLGRAAAASRVFVCRNELQEDGAMRSWRPFEWTQPGVRPIGGLPGFQGLSWRAAGLADEAQRLSRGEAIYRRVRRLPVDARRLFEPAEILSFALAPILVRDDWWGVLGFEDCLQEREWPGYELDGLRAVAGIVAAAVHRTQIGEELRQYATRPAVVRAAAAGGTEERSAEEVCGGRETLLLCETDPAALASLRRVLEGSGYRVLCAAEPSEALARARAFPGRIHLLITDVVMPEMNGTELSAAIGELRAGARTLFVSRYASGVLARFGILDRHTDYLEKPFDPRTLLRQVRRILDGRRPIAREN